MWAILFVRNLSWSADGRRFSWVYFPPFAIKAQILSFRFRNCLIFMPKDCDKTHNGKAQLLRANGMWGCVSNANKKHFRIIGRNDFLNYEIISLPFVVWKVFWVERAANKISTYKAFTVVFGDVLYCVLRCWHWPMAQSARLSIPRIMIFWWFHGFAHILGEWCRVIFSRCMFYCKLFKRCIYYFQGIYNNRRETTQRMPCRGRDTIPTMLAWHLAVR